MKQTFALYNSQQNFSEFISVYHLAPSFRWWGTSF